MSRNIVVTHSLEAPLYVVPHTNFLETLKQYSRPPFSDHAILIFWHGEFTFIFSSDDGMKTYCSTRAFLPNKHKPFSAEVEQKLITFSSKFNCVMTYRNCCALNIDVVKPTFNDRALYGDSVRSIIKATITTHDLSVAKAINNFFSDIDLSYKNMEEL